MLGARAGLSRRASHTSSVDQQAASGQPGHVRHQLTLELVADGCLHGGWAVHPLLGDPGEVIVLGADVRSPSTFAEMSCSGRCIAAAYVAQHLAQRREGLPDQGNEVLDRVEVPEKAAGDADLLGDRSMPRGHCRAAIR